MCRLAHSFLLILFVFSSQQATGGDRRGTWENVSDNKLGITISSAGTVSSLGEITTGVGLIATGVGIAPGIAIALKGILDLGVNVNNIYAAIRFGETPEAYSALAFACKKGAISAGSGKEKAQALAGACDIMDAILIFKLANLAEDGLQAVDATYRAASMIPLRFRDTEIATQVFVSLTRLKALISLGAGIGNLGEGSFKARKAVAAEKQ